MSAGPAQSAASGDLVRAPIWAVRDRAAIVGRVPDLRVDVGPPGEPVWLWLERAEMRAELDGRRLGLSWQQFIVLECLMMRPDVVVGRDELCLIASSATTRASDVRLREMVHRVRAEIGPGQIRTVRAQGYAWSGRMPIPVVT